MLYKLIGLIIALSAVVIFNVVMPRESYNEIASEIVHPYAASIEQQDGELRSQLDDGDRELYDVIKKGLLEYDTEIVVRRFSYTEDDIQNVMWYIMQDSPEIFWVEWKWDVRSQTDGFTIVPSYIFDTAEIDAKRAELEQAAEEIVGEAEAAGDTSLARVRYVHDYLIQNCTYNEDAGNVAHTSYGAIMGHEAVCDGYTQAVRLLLGKLGIESRYVEGTATSDGRTQGHAWNLVKIEDSWCNMDVTWDDGDHTDSDGNPTGLVSYTYFLLSDDEMTADHTVDNRAELPECAGFDYFSYVGLSGASLKDISVGVTDTLFANAKQGRYYVQFRITDPEQYKATASSDIFGLGMTDIVNDVNSALELMGYSQRIYDLSCECHQDTDHDLLLVIFEEAD